MIIRGWHVDGFGSLANFGVRDLDPGLTVVAGANEAGKSTLLAFLRFALFGWPRSRDRRLPPLRGGRNGGRIFLSEKGRDGAWTVERYGDRRAPALLAPDGTAADPGELPRLLGGADADVFASVFAFGLDELSRLETLTNEGVRGQIFSAGITGAGADVRQALQRLESEAATILRPRGRSRVQEILGRVEHNARAAAAARAAGAHYPDVLAAEDAARARIAELTERLHALRGRERHLRRLVEIWPSWQRAQGARARLQALPDPGPFPVDGLTRLEALLERRQEARRTVVRLEGERAELASRPTLTPTVASAVSTLAAEAALQRQRLEDLPAQESELRQLRIRQAAALAEVGPDWTETRLAGADASVSTLEGLADWGERLRQAAEDQRAAEQMAEAAAVNVASTREGLDGLDVPFPTLRAWERAGADLEETLARARVAVGMLGAGAAFALAALVLVAAGHPLAAGLGGAIALAFWVWGRGGLRLRQQELRLAQWRRQEGAVRQRDVLERQLVIQERALSEREDLARRMADARAHLEHAWVESCRAAGMPAGLRPEGVRAFVQALRRARELEAAVRAAAARKLATEKAIAAWETRARSAARMAGAPPESGPTLVAWVVEAEARVRREREAALRAEELGARLQEAGLALADLDEQWLALLAAAGVSAEGAVEEEAVQAERFRAQAARWLEYREAVRAHDAAWEQLAVALGEGPAAEALASELEAGDIARWEGELESTAQQIGSVEEERLAAARAERQAEMERQALEHAEDIAQLAAEGEQLRAELGAALWEYRRNQLAQALLRKTLAEFMAARQPDVLRVASGALAGITSGRYARVIQDEQGENLAVLDRHSRRVEPTALSRGTQEQLYLALRLGLAASFARRSTALPLIMDDVLVNFDPERAIQTARFLAAFARGHAGPEQGQVIVFTCHPETVACVRDADPEARVVEMPVPWETARREVAAARQADAPRRRRRATS